MTHASPKPPPATATTNASWIIAAVTCVGAYLVLFGLIRYSQGYFGVRLPVFSTAYAFWTGYEDWQHGMVVPFLSAIVIWIERRKLAAIPVQGSNWGLPILVFSLAAYWLGFVIDHHYLGFVSAQILVAGMIIWFLGWRMMQALIFPWAFLMFTWPFLFLDSVIAFPLRMILSNFAYLFLNGIGLASAKIGSAVVSAPDPHLGLSSGQMWAIDIADPCSGMRSLFALLMVSALYSHFAMRGFWPRLLVVAAAIPFAILGNFVRIMLLVFGTIILGPDIAIGSLEDPSYYHMVAGYFVFIVAIGAMLGLAKALAVDWSSVPDMFRQLRTRKGPAVDQKVDVPSPAQDIY